METRIKTVRSVGQWPCVAPEGVIFRPFVQPIHYVAVVAAVVVVVRDVSAVALHWDVPPSSGFCASERLRTLPAITLPIDDRHGFISPLLLPHCLTPPTNQEIFSTFSLVSILYKYFSITASLNTWNETESMLMVKKERKKKKYMLNDNIPNIFRNHSSNQLTGLECQS